MPVSQFRRIDAVLAPNSGARPLPSYDGRSHTTNEDERGRHECARATLNHAHRGRATGSHGIFPWAADAEHRGGQHSHSRTCAKAGVSNPAHSAVANFRADGRRRSRAVHRGLLLRMDAADRRADARASGCVGSADGGDWRTGDAGSELGRESWGRAASCNWRRRSSCDWESAAPDSARLSNWERSFSAANAARITARGDSAEAAATLRRLRPLKAAFTLEMSRKARADSAMLAPFSTRPGRGRRTERMGIRIALARLPTRAGLRRRRECVSKDPTHDWLCEQRTKPLADKHSDEQPNDRSITSSLLHESLKKERGGNKTRCRDLSQANLAHGAIQLRNVAEDAFGLRHSHLALCRGLPQRRRTAQPGRCAGSRA